MKHIEIWLNDEGTWDLAVEGSGDPTLHDELCLFSDELLSRLEKIRIQIMAYGHAEGHIPIETHPETGEPL